MEERVNMVGVGSNLPPFALQMVKYNSNGVFSKMTHEDLKGKWSVIFTWPFDFTFVCPTEIIEFSNYAKKLSNEYSALN